MSENTQVQSEQENQQSQSAEQTQETETNTTWTAEQLAQRLKAVNEEAKTNRKKYQEEKKRREELEKRAMAENGQFKELAEVWQRKAADAEKMAEQIKEAFAFKSVADSVTLEAQKMGCVDPEALVSLINLKELPLDETFSVDKTHVKAVLEDVRKTKPYFFKSAAPKIADATPAKTETPKLDLSKMSLMERAQLLSTLKKSGK